MRMTLDLHNRCGSFTSFATFDSSSYPIRLDCNKKTTLETHADVCQQGLMLWPKLDASKAKHPRNVTIALEFWVLVLKKISATVTDVITDTFLQVLLTAVQITSHALFRLSTFYCTQCGKEGKKVLPADKVQYRFILSCFIFLKIRTLHFNNTG